LEKPRKLVKPFLLFGPFRFFSSNHHHLPSYLAAFFCVLRWIPFPWRVGPVISFPPPWLWQAYGRSTRQPRLCPARLLHAPLISFAASLSVFCCNLQFSPRHNCCLQDVGQNALMPTWQHLKLRKAGGVRPWWCKFIAEQRPPGTQARARGGASAQHKCTAESSGHWLCGTTIVRGTSTTMRPLISESTGYQ
jgi:hypothetical protein